MNRIMIADNEFYLRLFNFALYFMYMEKTLPSRGVFGNFARGQVGYKIVGNANGVDHFVFGVAWVYTFSYYGNLGLCRIEVFIFQFAHLATIHGVGPFRTEFFYVKFVCAATNFFVRGTGNPNF